MGWTGFLGLFLLGCSPLAAVGSVCIFPKSFLLLLALGR